MDKLDFLEGQPSEQPVTPAAEPPPAPEAPQAQAPEPSSGPVRGPDGKFASAQAPEPVAAPPVATPQEPPPPAHVPISALMDERDKRKALEAQIAAFQSQQQAPQVPDRFEDPEGYEAFQEQRFQQAIYETRRDMSKRFAEMQHTPEVVAKAHEWAFQKAALDPAFNAKALASPDPYGFAVAEMRKEELLSRVDPAKFDPAQYEAFLAWQQSQGVQSQQASAPAPTPSAPPPPVSLVSAPSAGGAAHVPSGPGQAFGRAFG